jgi:tRNA isopentenyl-2-thiomethyl-A-37 hydroxylase MiaE
MNQCNDYVEQIYLSPKVNDLISKIEPKELQDDLRQEMAIVLLTYDCKKLIRIFQENNLIAFASRIVWKMGTLQNGNFYRTYRKKDLNKAYEYMQSLVQSKDDLSSVKYAKKILNEKLLSNPNDAHESMIFSKYVELRSCQKVADFFNIPRLHVHQVVNKTKKELKDSIKKQW